MDDFVCSECCESIKENASVCPHCGSDPAADLEKQAKILYVFASISFFTIIGSPLGIALGWTAHKRRKKKSDASPAIPADS